MSNDLLKACEVLFCDPEGNPCFYGSDGDRAELARAMQAARTSPGTLSEAQMREQFDRSGKPDDDHWQTPQWLYDKLDAEFHFDFDPCPNYATFDGLIVPWGKSNFINPPYNRVDKPKFIQKAYNEWRGATCVLLIPSATGTNQFHDLILPHAEIRFHRGRITFVPAELPRNATEKQIRAFAKEQGRDSTKGKHDSMIVIFRGETK